MNKTYKVVWNDALGLFQVVNEFTRGRKKSAGGRNPDASDVVGGASGLRISALAAAVSSLLLITTPSFAGDMEIPGLKIGETSTSSALTTGVALPNNSFDKVILNSPAANKNNLFLQGQGIEYKVSDTILTINGNTLFVYVDDQTTPGFAFIDLDSAAKGKYEFTLSGQSGDPLMLNAKLTKLELQDGQTFVLVRSGSDPSDFTAVITGTGNLKTEGDMTLSGTNEYRGKTEVATGTVTMGSNAAFGESTDLTVADGATVDMNGKNLKLVKVAGTGTVNVNGGTLTLNLTSAAPDLAAKLTGGGKVVIAMAAAGDTVGFQHVGTDFSGEYEITKGQVNLDANGKQALGSAATVKLVSADNSVDSVKMTVNDPATLKNVSVDDATIVFAFGGKKLGETGAPKLNVMQLTAESTGTTRVDVTQDLNLDQGSVNWLQADDNGESQVLISGGIVNPTGIEVYLNGTTDVTAGTTLKQDVKNGTTAATVAKAEYDVTVTRTATEVGMKKTLKSLSLEDSQGDGLVITRPAATANDDDITLKTKLTGAGNVTFDPLGQNIIVKQANPGTDPNDYTGKTFIRNGEVIAQTQNAFGNTSELNIATDGKVSMKDHQQAGALVTATGSHVDVSGFKLTVGDGVSKVDGNLEGSGKIHLQGSQMTVSSANAGLAGTVSMDAATLKLKDVEALGSARLSSTGMVASNLTLAANGGYDNQLSGNFNLTIGDAAPVAVELTGNNAGMSGQVSFQNNSKLTVSDLPTRIGTSLVNTTGGELHVKDVDTTIKNTITGSGKLHLKAAGKLETQFAGSGDEAFTGTVEAEGIKFKASGTAKQFKHADVVLGARAEYKADESQTVKSMHAQSGSKLDFTGTVNPLTVTGDLTLDDGSDVEADLPGTFTKDILDQITGDSVVLARASGTVSLDSNAKLNGRTGEQVMTGSVCAGAADATYKTKLDGTNGLAVTRKLTALDLQAGKALDIDASSTTNKNISVAVGGSGNLNFKAGNVEFSSDDNTYTGTTTLSGGTLNITGVNALGKTSKLNILSGQATVAADQELNASLEVASAAKLELAGNTLKLTNGTSHVNGTLAGSGGLWINGGQLDVASGNSSFGGTTTLEAGAKANLNDADSLGGASATINFKDNTGTVTLSKTGAADIKAKLSGAGTVEVDLGGATNALTLSNNGNNFTGTLKVKNAGLTLTGNEASTLAAATLATDENAKVNVKTGNTTVGGVKLAGGELAFEKLTVGDAADSSMLTAGTVVVEAAKVTNVSIGALAGSTTTGTMSVNVLDADNDGEKDMLISGSVAGPIDNLNLTSTLGSVKQTLTGADATWEFDQKLVKTAYGLGLHRKLTKLELTDAASAAGYVINSTGATDKTLTAQLTGSGNVMFHGTNPITVYNGANDYTGKTTIENTVVAGSNNALGQTSALDIKAGGQFDLNGKTQTVKNLTTQALNALYGNGQMTLGGTSAIHGANAMFTAATTLASGSSTTLFDAEGLGKGGISFADAAAGLILKDLGTGAVSKYANSLSGAGTLSIDNSNVELTGGNSGFSGSVAFANNGKLNVSTPNTQIGSAKVNSTDGTLVLTTSTDLDFSNNLTGSGTVEVATGGHSVKLSDADAFAGTLKLDQTSIDGGDNAGVLDAAKLELANKSLLTVKSGGQTIDKLTVDATSTLEFNDKFAPGLDFAGKLAATNGIALANGAKVVLDRASVESTKDTKVFNDDRNLLDQDGNTNSVTLATGIATAGDVKLVDKAGNEISNASTATVVSNGEEVADATYNYSVSGDSTGLKVGYGLAKVYVREGKALVLDTTGATDKTFSAELAGKGGLTVKGDTVTLTHVDNTYSGETTVTEGNLIAQAKNALGKTSKVTVDGGKTLTVQAAQENVGTLDAIQGTVDLQNGASLTLNNGQSKIAAAAELKGEAGTTLVVNDGSLDIKGAKSYKGNAHLKNGAMATLNNVAGLGNDAGSTVTLDAGTTLGLTHAGDADIRSKLTGAGVLEVGLNAPTANLSFSNTDNAFTGMLVLNTGRLALAGAADNNRKTLDAATLKTGANADVKVSSGLNKLGGLTLAGGKIGFGAIDLNGTTSAGYVDLAGTGKLVIDSDTNVDLSLSAAANLTTGGSELLSMDEGAHVALVTNSNQTITNVERLKFTGTASQTSTLKQSGVDVAKATWALGDQKFATANEGRDLVVNYKLQELNLQVTTPNSGLVVTNTTAADQTLSAKLTGAGNIRFNGDTTFGGGIITVNNVNNDYTGITYIERGEVVAGADNALGQTKELNISSGASFNLDSHSQTVGDLITASGNALKSTGGSLTLKGTNSDVKGANAGLNAKIALVDGSKTKLDNVMGLGTGSIAIGSSDDVLTLSGANGQFANTVTGNGGLTLDNGSNVELMGANTDYEGKVTANAGTKLTVNGPVADHLGKGQLHVDGTANLTQSGDWTLNNTLTGNGTVTVSADKAGGDGTFALGTGAGSAFNGNLVLTEANMTLSDVASSEGKINADALADATLTAGTNGVVNVEKGNAVTGSLTMDGGTLVFAGSATPGVHQSETAPVDPSKAEAHLTVNNMNLTDGTVKVDLSANVNPDYSVVNDSLTMQDVLVSDQGDVTTMLVKANDTVTGSAGNLTLVDQHGNTVGSSKTLKIQDEGGNAVADGEYGLGLAVKNNNLGLAYQLNKVRVHDGKNLTLKGTAPAPDDNNTLVAVLTGQGGLKVSEGAITLANNRNDYTGMTEVLSGATLEARSNNAFGHTSGLDNKGTVKSNGFDQTIYGSVDNAGTLNIASSNWTVNKDLNQTGTLDVTVGANLNVQGDAALSGTSIVNGSTLTVAKSATVTGTTQLENATVNFGNGGSVAEGTLIGTTGNKLNFNGGEFRMLGANAGLTAASTVASGAVLTLEKSAEAVGKIGSVDVAGQLNFKGANGDFSNALTGSGKVDFTGTNAAFTADNSAFSGTITLDEASNLSVTAVNQLGKGDASGTGAATIQGSGLVTMTSDAALNVDQIITGSVNIDKLGAGDLVMADHSLGSTGIIRMKGGVLRFGTPGAGASAAGSVELDAGTGMSAFGTVGGDLTVNAGASAFVSGDASAKAGVTAPKTLKVNGRTVNHGTLQIGHLDGPATATIGSRFETNDYVSCNGTIVVNALLNGDADSKLDTFKANGAASGTGKLTVNTVDAAGLGITRNVNGVTVAEFGEGTVDLSLTDEIKVNGLYYRLMKTDDGSRYYLSNQIQSAGTEAMSTSMLMQPEAGARAALAYAADQAFNISLHDHVGETLYIDQLTGEERLTSVWMAQTGDWTRWRDGTGQLYNKGQTLTTHIGGDLITWGPADKHRLSFGLLGGYSYADFDSTSDLTGWNAKGTFNGYSVGAYLAWQNVAEDGPFGSVQLRWNSFRNSVQGDGYEKEKYTSDGISAALEAGWNQQLLHMKLENGTSALWRVQPHVGVYWSNISADEQTDVNGQRFVTDGDNNVTLRLGGRTSITFAETQVPGVVDPGLTFYVEGNWIRNTGNYTTTLINQNGESTADLTADNLGEVRFGVEGHVNRNIQLWGDVHHRVGDQSYRSTGVMLGGKYVW